MLLTRMWRDRDQIFACLMSARGSRSGDLRTVFDMYDKDGEGHIAEDAGVTPVFQREVEGFSWI